MYVLGDTNDSVRDMDICCLDNICTFKLFGFALLQDLALCFCGCCLRYRDCLMEPESATLPWSCPQNVASSTFSNVGDSATVNSRLLHFTNCSDIATSSKPVVVSSDSGIFMDRSMSASEQTGDTQASRSSSAQSVDRLDCVDRPNSAVRCCSSSTDRPTSALARGVQIVEYPRWNPKPVNEESLVLMEEYLCPRKLVRLYSFTLNTFFLRHLLLVQPQAKILIFLTTLCLEIHDYIYSIDNNF